MSNDDLAQNQDSNMYINWGNIMKLSFCFFLISLTCCNQAHSTEELEKKATSEFRLLYQEKDPVVINIVESSKGEAILYFGFSYEQLKPLIQFNEICQEYFTTLGPTLKDTIHLVIADEILSLAIESRKGLIEKLSGTNDISEHLSLYFHNLDGSALFFINPSTKTSKISKVFSDRLNKLVSQEDMAELSNNPTFITCQLPDMYLGLLGGNTITKSIARNLSESISQANRNELLDNLRIYD